MHDELETLTHEQPAADWAPETPKLLIEEAAEHRWPEGVPRDFNQFFREYGSFIDKQVMKYNKITRNFEDLAQEIRMRLVASDLLNKFVKRAAKTMPETLEAKDCLSYLGIDWTTFHGALAHQDKVGLSIRPIEGDLFAKNAVFFTADIKDLDGALPIKRPLAKKCPWVSPLGFKAYLTQAIHNTFANWCRTHKRKFRDLTLLGTQVLAPTASGDYIQTGHNEESYDWESRLVAVALNDEDLLSVVESVEQECAEEDIELRDETGALSSRGREILDFIADGRTVQEAIAAQQRAENRLRARSLG